MENPDHLILCLSQPSLSARDETALLGAVLRAGQAQFAGSVTAIRLEGSGLSLPKAVQKARESGARHVRVQPVGFPMAASIRAWLPGVVAHLPVAEDIRLSLADPSDPDAMAQALVTQALAADMQDAASVRPSLGKAGWQFLPDFDLHIFICAGPRCAFRGAATLQTMLKARLSAAGLSDRCLTTTTGCLFPCNQGPVIAVYPQGAWFHVPDEVALDRIVTDVLVAGGDAPDLRLTERPGSRRALSFSHLDRSLS